MYTELLIEEILKTSIAPFSVFNDTESGVIDLNSGSKILFRSIMSREFITIHNCLVVDNEITQMEIDAFKQQSINANAISEDIKSTTKLGADGVRIKNIIVCHEKNRFIINRLDCRPFSAQDLSYVFFRNEIYLL